MPILKRILSSAMMALVGFKYGHVIMMTELFFFWLHLLLCTFAISLFRYIYHVITLLLYHIITSLLNLQHIMLFL